MSNSGGLHEAATLDVLRQISSTLSSMKLSLDQANARLGAIERHHSSLAADFALVMADRNVTGMLEKGTVGKLQVRYFKRTTQVTDCLLATTELLELILLKLPMRDLLLAQRVSKRFKQVIDTTPAIQRALYFEPQLSGTIAQDHKPRINPLLDYCFSLLVFNDKRKAFVIKTPKHVVPSLDPSQANVDTAFDWDAVLSLYPVVPIHTTPAKVHFANGSWRRMFITQPPCPLRLDSSNSSRVAATLRQPRRLGEVWQAECYHDREAYGCIREYMHNNQAPPRLAED